jgi:hypothetical protein
MSAVTILTDRFDRALLYAMHVHGGQARKGTSTPYVAHLLAVAVGSSVKILSIRQPWAYLITQGYKNIENRGWPTNYRGQFLVHASSQCRPASLSKAWARS